MLDLHLYSRDGVLLHDVVLYDDRGPPASLGPTRRRGDAGTRVEMPALTP